MQKKILARVSSPENESLFQENSEGRPPGKKENGKKENRQNPELKSTQSHSGPGGNQTRNTRKFAHRRLVLKGLILYTWKMEWTLMICGNWRHRATGLTILHKGKGPKNLGVNLRCSLCIGKSHVEGQTFWPSPTGRILEDNALERGLHFLVVSPSGHWSLSECQKRDSPLPRAASKIPSRSWKQTTPIGHQVLRRHWQTPGNIEAAH